MIWFSATASCTFVFFSSAAGSPRSANTFPELATTPLLLFAISRLVILFRESEPTANQFDIRLGRLDAAWRFLLERMQYVNCSLKPHRVDSPVSIAAEVFDNFRNSLPFAFPRLGFRVFASKLRNTQGRTNLILHRLGKVLKIIFRRTYPKQRLLTRNSFRSCH